MPSPEQQAAIEWANRMASHHARALNSQPTQPQVAFAPPALPRLLNPAERALIQAEAKEGQEVKEQAEPSVPHEKGKKRNDFSVKVGRSLYNKARLKKELEEEWQKKVATNNRLATEFGLTEEEALEALNDDRKKFDRYAHGYLGRYNINKHEKNPFVEGEASLSFFNNWGKMSPAEQDALIAQENALKNSPERVAQKQTAQARQQREYIADVARLGAQQSQQQNQRETERLDNLTPAQREQETYNRQLADYFEQQQRYEYQNHAQAINQNRQAQGKTGLNGNVPVPQPVLNELISMINSQPTRYVPVRPRPSINDRVMNSFGQNMFSPEFMAEEE